MTRDQLQIHRRILLSHIELLRFLASSEGFPDSAIFRIGEACGKLSLACEDLKEADIRACAAEIDATKGAGNA